MSQPALQPAAAPATLSDQEVVERVLAGDTSLFEILMRRLRPAALPRRPRHPRGRRGGRGRHAGGLHAGLPRARQLPRRSPVRHLAHPHRLPRSAGPRPETPPARPRFLAAAASLRTLRRRAAGPEREMENRELQAVLHEAVEVLPDPLRAVFCLREIEGLSTEQTADALGLTVENVQGAPAPGQARPAADARPADRPRGAPALPLRRPPLRPHGRGLLRPPAPRTASVTKDRRIA